MLLDNVIISPISSVYSAEFSYFLIHELRIFATYKYYKTNHSYKVINEIQNNYGTDYETITKSIDNVINQSINIGITWYL